MPYYYYGIDWTYLVIVLPCILLAAIASARVNSTFRRYSQQISSRHITGAEAAVMLQSALDLSVSPDSISTDGTVPVWAEHSLAALSGSGMELDAAAPLTRSDTAKLLYQAVRMKEYPVFSE